jgi:hypothetical protein
LVGTPRPPPCGVPQPCAEPREPSRSTPAGKAQSAGDVGRRPSGQPKAAKLHDFTLGAGRLRWKPRRPAPRGQTTKA